ncbi:DUF6716 putative glycosyltransferase [Streptomyces sp. NPDC000594]|uniref:DUF6716 putative glycosyltransferase n=1 Tax=Streptomyces sp. NPDC000594 TaxID=3154261 RepID=UPI00331CE575
MPSPTSEAERGTPRVAVLADSDTRWKWGALTARRIAPEAPAPTGFLLRGRATPTARQLAEIGAEATAPREVTGTEFLRAVVAEGYDVIVLALVGGGVQAMLHGLAALAPDPRPVVVTGYVGVVYEKLADGLLLRHGADLVLANSRQDAERFRAVYEGVGADPSPVAEAALPFLGGDPYRPEAGRDTLCFATQPSVPASRADRSYILERLIGHARLHPGREVLVKLRSRPGEHTTHLEELPYQRLAARIPGGPPPNLRLVHGHMGEVLDRTDLLVTLSSTAALEALHRGIPTAVLTDLGIREAHGNHHFIGSGLLTSFDRLDAGHRPVPDPRWLALQGVAADGRYATAFDTVRERLTRLLAGPPLPPIRPYYTLTSAPGYLPGILARHRLAPDGTPLPGPETAGAAGDTAPGNGVRRVMREAVRGAARGAYRQGVQRVAPVIRRMGEL